MKATGFQDFIRESSRNKPQMTSVSNVPKKSSLWGKKAKRQSRYHQNPEGRCEKVTYIRKITNIFLKCFGVCFMYVTFSLCRLLQRGSYYLKMHLKWKNLGNFINKISNKVSFDKLNNFSLFATNFCLPRPTRSLPLAKFSGVNLDCALYKHASF